MEIKDLELDKVYFTKYGSSIYLFVLRDLNTKNRINIKHYINTDINNNYKVKTFSINCNSATFNTISKISNIREATIEETIWMEKYIIKNNDNIIKFYDLFPKDKSTDTLELLKMIEESNKYYTNE